MRAYQFSKRTSFDDMAIVELPKPKPGRRQVLVKVAACSLNFRDLAIAVGTYRMPVLDKLIPLSDGAGEVVEVGADVTRVKAGDRVAGCFFQGWVAGPISAERVQRALGGSAQGMLAEYVVLEDVGVVRLPDHLSLEDGATLPCAAVTAWQALAVHGPLKPGETVLVQGTGGVSIFALQFAQMMGGQVIATSSSDEKLARAKSLGAIHGINYKARPDWDKAVLEFTNGRGVDHVVEVGGAGTLERSLGAVCLGGRISVIGVLTGIGADQSEFHSRPARERPGNVRRINRDVRGHEPRDGRRPLEAGDRQGVSVRSGARGVSLSWSPGRTSGRSSSA